MKTIKLIGGIIIIMLAVVIVLQVRQTPNGLGSVAQSGEYKYTSLSGAVSTSTTAIKTGAGTLGSIVITADAASGDIAIYDATSTAALSGGASLFTKIGDLEDGLLEGTYTFDTSFLQWLSIRYNRLVSLCR